MSGSRAIRDEELAHAFEEEGEGGNAPSPRRDDPVVAMQFPVEIRRVRTRVLNPRLFPNPKRAAIKASLRAQGVTHLWPITRRPGDDYYITYAGGDTRTELLQELCEESGDARFCRPTLFYRPWSEGMSETGILGGAITENLAKGEMCLFETASAYLSLKAFIEAELRLAGELEEGRGLPASRFVALMEARGVPCSSPSMSRYNFLLEYFDGLADPMKPALTNEFVKEAQPCFTRYRRLLTALGEEAPDEWLKETVASLAEGIFTGARLFEHMSAALAEMAGRTPSEIETALERLADRNRDPATLFSADERRPPPANDPAADRGDEERADFPPEKPEEGSADPAGQGAEPASTPTPPVARPPSAVTLETIHEQVMTFARATGVDLAVRRLPDDPMAFGFFMELLPLEQDAQRIAWWLLAMHSLQTQERVIEQLIPHTAHWHKAVTADPETRNAELIGATVGAPTAHNLIRLPAGFVLGPGLEPSARIAWAELFQTLTAFQCANPERFGWQLLGLLQMEGAS